MNERINKDWLSDFPFSFGGKYRSYNEYKNLSRKQIDESFNFNDIYSRFKQYRKLKYDNPVYSRMKREQFQADVCYMTDKLLVQATKGYKYLLVVIDVFTKYSWVFPLKSIKASEIVECFKELFKSDKPRNLTTDAGLEFVNLDVKRVLKKFKIKHYIARGRTKAQIAERFILTLQRLIYQICRARNTNNWVSVLNTSMKIYLNRKHRTIGMSPNQAELPENQITLSRIHNSRYTKIGKKRKRPKFKIGDSVRISLTRSKFKRGYTQSFSTEVWYIHEILSNLPFSRYIVKDEQGEILKCVLNENEIVRYIPNDVYQVEYVIKKRKRGKKTQFFVKWLHHDEKFNSWVDAKDIVQL